MRKTAANMALALLLLTGCTSATEEALPAAAPSASSPAAPSVTPVTPAKDPMEESCRKLTGPESKAPLSQAIYFVRIQEGTYGFNAPPESARTVAMQIRSIAATAPEGLDMQLEEFLLSLGTAISAAESPDAASGFDMFAWQSTIADIQATCGL